MTTLHKYLAAAALAVMPLGALAQTNGSNSPYSRYGFGLLGDGGNAFNKGMAGTAYGMRNGTELNTKTQPRMLLSTRCHSFSTWGCHYKTAISHKTAQRPMPKHLC